MNPKYFLIFALAVVLATIGVTVGSQRIRRWGPHSWSAQLKANAPAASKGTAGLIINGPMPNFALYDTTGDRHALKDARGKIVVLLVQGNRCPCSESYVPRINAINRDYRPRGVEVWAFNPNQNETETETRAFARRQHCEYLVAYDRGFVAAGALHAACTTEAWIVDRQGILRYHGRVDDNIFEPKKVKVSDLRNALDDLLANRPVAVPETRAYACSVRRLGA
ncbi:MAG TPA: redoxin domain-containing protein [Armatimonadota bacterium]|jgi:peroxiredoxin